MPIPLGTRVAVKSVDVGTLPEHDELRGVALVCFFFSTARVLTRCVRTRALCIGGVVT